MPRRRSLGQVAMKTTSPITITDSDIQRLSSVVAAFSERDDHAANALQVELDRANVVASAAVSPAVVTMNSRMILRDERGEAREASLVYPWHANADAGKISVLAPLGCALLGASAGDRVDVLTKRGVKTWFVESIRYQPEAAGEDEP